MDYHSSVTLSMDKTGVAMIVIGLVLIAAGIYGITLLTPEVVTFLIGLIELAIVIVGLGLLVVGAIMAKE
ncbi:ABC-type multidrug transport system permease subunit [Methanofollis sp. W23]|nr:ABC-type multidrug transport system permease subunit [Methanofollis sp. W23]